MDFAADEELPMYDPLHRFIINSLSGGVIATDMHGMILLGNEAAETHLGLSAGRFDQGGHVDSVPELAPLLPVFNQLRDTHEPVSRAEVEFEVNGSRRVFGVTASIMSEHGVEHGMVLIFSDLTRVRELEQAAELNRQLAQIGELTAGVVHEIRNPLSVVSGMAELLHRKLGEQPELLDKAAVIMQEVEGLDRLIREFLSFSSTHRIERLPCNAEALVDRVKRQVERLARERGVRFDTKVPAAPISFIGDFSKLVQAAGNLARNAIEITPSGKRVSLSVSQDSGSVYFAVEDQGPGIHLKPGDDVFSPFFSKKDGGTGLGLSIVHRIVAAHGGTVYYENRDEGGARFEMRLPLQGKQES
ncbi:MAG: PAS domain-containing protein [Candidatus Hydrogenedens sp.]|nr:PAS domain-containing protein [Candidatus Hydrogenedens sp.]